MCRPINKYRHAANLTQRNVAELLDLSEVYVRKIEKGHSNPGRETMIKFSKLFNEKPEKLFPDLFCIHDDKKCI